MIAASLLHPDVSPRVVDRFRSSGVEMSIQDNLEDSKNLSAALIFGGDGTVHRHLPQLHQQKVPLLVVPAGSGNDFGKSIGVRHENIDAVMRAIAERRTRTLDAGKVNDRYFLNVVGMGFDIAVIDDAATTPLLRGDMLYKFCAVKQLFRFPGVKLGIAEGNNSPDTWLRVLMLTISNANYFGGSFHIAPRARLDDGRVDLVAIHDAAPLTRAKLFDAVGKGKHEGHPKVDFRTAVSFSIHFEGTLRYEADGEVYSSPSPLVVMSVRGALNVCAPLATAR